MPWNRPIRLARLVKEPQRLLPPPPQVWAYKLPSISCVCWGIKLGLPAHTASTLLAKPLPSPQPISQGEKLWQRILLSAADYSRAGGIILFHLSLLSQAFIICSTSVSSHRQCGGRRQVPFQSSWGTRLGWQVEGKRTVHEQMTYTENCYKDSTKQ